ncbi:MAG: hypothetical protein ABI688_00800 [Bacteroidota bacterium]
MIQMKNLNGKRSVQKAGQLFFLLLFSFVSAVEIKAQTAISSAASSYTAAPTGTTYVANGASNSSLSGNSYTYTYGNLSGTANNNLHMNSFIASGVTYFFYPIANSVVKMRRVNNALVTGTRNLKFEEGTVAGATIALTSTYDDDMESFFNKNGFNAGTDNLFANMGDGNGNFNNIERVDVIFPFGTVASDNTKVGFPIFERGVNGAHDPVKAALILSINGANMPTSYSPILSVTSPSYGGADLVASKNYVIARRDNAVEPNLRISTTTNQAIGGVLFKYSDFGIPNNTTVYGYSLFATDFTGTPAQALDYTNATFFPINTDGATGAGGIDLVAFTGIAQSSPVLPVELLSFSVQKVSEQALLKWTTASEQNSSHFEIQRSTDGITFDAIGNLVASGNSSSVKQYQLVDDIRSLAAPVIYYRIKMVNLDNNFVWSPVAVITRSVRTIVKLYPQPLSGQSYLDIDKAGYYRMKLFNTAGMLVQNWDRIFISPQQPLNIYNKKLTAGIYYLQVNDLNSGLLQLAKVIVQ